MVVSRPPSCAKAVVRCHLERKRGEELDDSADMNYRFGGTLLYLVIGHR